MQMDQLFNYKGNINLNHNEIAVLPMRMGNIRTVDNNNVNNLMRTMKLSYTARRSGKR